MRQRRWISMLAGAVLFLLQLPGTAFGLDNVQGVCKENCGGSSGGGGGGNSPVYYSPPTETHAEKKARLQAAGEEEWRTQAPGRRYEWARQKESVAALQREGESLARQGIPGADVPDRNSARFLLPNRVRDQGTGIKNRERARNDRQLHSEMERLHCAARITGSLFGELDKGDAADLTEARYLADEAANVLVKGITQGLACPPAETPGFYGKNQLWTRERMLALVEDTGRQVQSIEQAKKALPTLQMIATRKEGLVQDLQTEVKTMKTEMQGLQGDIARASKIQTDKQREYEEQIRDVAKKQEEKQRAMAEALAALKKV